MFAPSVLTETEKKRMLAEVVAVEPTYEKGDYTSTARIAERYPTAVKNAEKAAQKYNISQMLFKKWCRSYGINPQHKKEYIEKYEVEFLGKEPKKKRPCLKILQIDPNINEIVNIFASCADASNKLKLPKTSINDNLDKNKLYAGYYWKRSNEKGNRLINQK